MSKKLNKSQVTITLPADMLEMVKENAKNESMTVSVYIQMAMKSYLDQQEIIKLSRMMGASNPVLGDITQVGR